MIPAPGRLITLTTDFGTRDGYAGAMKGVIRHTSPEACVEDLTHEIPPGDIKAAAWTLRTAIPFYPRGSVHVVVVDPGVGTDRNAMLAYCDGQFLIGPDNGVFSWLLRGASRKQAWRLSDDAWRSQAPAPTFHGRDLFAHAAALIVEEGDVSRICGEEISPVILETVAPEILQNGGEGHVLHVDHFGNVITNIEFTEDQDLQLFRIELPKQGLLLEKIYRTYGDVGPGEVLGLIGSHRFLEIAVREGSAREEIGLNEGDPVRVIPGTARGG